MKDTTRQYETTIRGHEYTFTAHSTKAGARATINESLNPCLVEVIVNGKVMYDAFPASHPIPDDAEIIERCRLSAGGYRWKTVGLSAGKYAEEVQAMREMEDAQ